MRKIPYYANPDDTHCMPCSLKMAFGYFKPDEEWDFDRLDKFTGKVEGKFSWPMRVCLSLDEAGYQIEFYHTNDFKELSKRREEYLYEVWGDKQAKVIIDNSDMELVSKDSLEFVNRNMTVEGQVCEFDRARELLDDGFLITCWVDQTVLMKENDDPYPHTILLYDYDGDYFYAHNSGSKNKGGQIASQKIHYKSLEEANNPPESGGIKNIIAFKPQDK